MKPSRLGYILVAVLTGFAVSAAWAAEPATQDQDLFTQFKKANMKIAALQVYNKQLERQLEDQQKTMAELNKSTEDTEATRRQLVPLLHEMVGSLERFVSLDLPFDLQKRQDRIKNLKESMDRPGISIAQKFKLVLQAYQTELDYGKTYETYTQFVTINGHQREVNVLRWGRLVLAFQTPDQQTAGVWDNQARKWEVLGSNFRSGIRKAFRVARGITSKTFVTLPVPAPTPAATMQEASRN